ncbi:MAG: DNA translocase FtsK [Planctomycetota bacterium]
MNDDEFDEPRRSRGVGGASASELAGGALFVLGALPAAAVAKALIKGTNLDAEGLGGFAWVASQIVHWVGAWPGILTAGAIALVGALLFAGTLRAEPLRFIAGAVVSGFGMAAIASALSLGAGGQLGDNTGGALGGLLGVLLGLAIIGVSAWLAFDGARARDEDGFAPVKERGDGFGIGARLAGVASAGATAVRSAVTPKERTEDRGAVKASRETRRIQTKKRKVAEPTTLGDALARGDGSEGVSHDEAAALAPDDQALQYMESVWRNAAMSFKQPEPVPPSPYPEDVRLSGGIPEGAAPLGVLEGGTPVSEAPSAPIEEAPEAPAVVERVEPTVPAVAGPGGPSSDVAPFDFPDEVGAPVPFDAPPTPAPAAATSQDPFGGEVAPALPEEERDALEAAARRESGETAAPRELPDGVAPLAPAEPSAPPAAVPAPGPEAVVQPAEPTLPPQPSWEVGYAADEASAPVADVDPATGHWPRREDPEAALDDALASLADEVPGLDELGLDAVAETDDDTEAESDVESSEQPSAGAPEVDVEEALEESVEPEAENESDASTDDDVAPQAGLLELDDAATTEDELELDATEAEDAEDALEEEEEEEDDELEEASDEEEVEYEYVDEDGNSIDPEDLAEGEWEEVDEEDEDEEDAEEAAELDDDEDAEEEDEAAEYEEAEAEDEEEVEYEYVDEEGNPIDPAELEEGEWEEVDEDEEVAAEAELDEEEAEEEDEAAELDGEESEAELDGEEAEDDGFEYEEVDEEATEETVEAEADALDTEPEVVLSPQPPPVALELSPDASRLFEAGQLLVREGRVAVSLLQNEFGVAFDEACELLDELQSEGLIGPYQGGKARDILLSAEEWENRFVGS